MSRMWMFLQACVLGSVAPSTSASFPMSVDEMVQVVVAEDVVAGEDVETGVDVEVVEAAGMEAGPVLVADVPRTRERERR